MFRSQVFSYTFVYFVPFHLLLFLTYHHFYALLVFCSPGSRHRVSLVCKVGCDQFGQDIYEFLLSDGLNTEAVVREPGVRTGMGYLGVNCSPKYDAKSLKRRNTDLLPLPDYRSLFCHPSKYHAVQELRTYYSIPRYFFTGFSLRLFLSPSYFFFFV